MADDIRAAQRELNAKVLGRDGISGTAIGQERGEPCLKVYVADQGAGRSVPKRVGGFPVVVEVSGPFRRF